MKQTDQIFLFPSHLQHLNENWSPVLSASHSSKATQGCVSPPGGSSDFQLGNFKDWLWALVKTETETVDMLHQPQNLSANTFPTYSIS